jgi:hypothetical protein
MRQERGMEEFGPCKFENADLHSRLDVCLIDIMDYELLVALCVLWLSSTWSTWIEPTPFSNYLK